MIAALAFMQLQGGENVPELQMLGNYLNTWRGLGDIVRGMQRQEFRLYLTNVEEGIWRATFTKSAMLAAEGFGTGKTPWAAVQQAAWVALERERPNEERDRGAGPSSARST